MKLVAGNSNRPLAEAIAAYLGLPLTKCSVRRFADMEIFVEIQENVRGQDVFVLQSTSFPTNDHLMELLIMIDAFMRSSARRITAVIPYYSYARSDKKDAPRISIAGRLVADLLVTAGANRVLVPAMVRAMRSKRWCARVDRASLAEAACSKRRAAGWRLARASISGSVSSMMSEGMPLRLKAWRRCL